MNGTRPSSVAVLILMLILAASTMSLVCRPRPSEQQSESVIPEEPTAEAKQGIAYIGRDTSSRPVESPVEPIEPVLMDTMEMLAAGPILVSGRAIVYPQEGLKAGVQGTVKLHIYVNDKGRVTKVKVVESVHPALDLAATEAARECVFLPKTYRGQPMGSWISVPVTFFLQDSPRQNP